MQPKRILISILAVILICLVAGTTVSATEASPALKLGVSVSSDTAVSKEPVTVQAGDTLKVSVTVAENPGVALIQFRLKYDPAVFSVKTDDNGVVYSLGNFFPTENIQFVSVAIAKAGELKIMIQTDADTSASLANGNNTILTVEFEALACPVATKGETVFTADKGDGNAFTSNFAPVAITAASAKVVAHNKLEVVTPAKADCVGTVYKCPACETEFTADAKAAHNYVDMPEVPAACGVPGTTAGEQCDKCGDVKSGMEEIPALEHDLVPVPKKEATCDEDGYEAYVKCQREGCDYTTEIVVLPMLGHDLEEVAAKAPNCTDDGHEAYQACQRCDYTTEIVVLPKLDHDLSQYDAKEPNCTEDGWDAYEACNREGCGYTTQEIKPLLGHDLKDFAAKDVTCLEDGWNAYQACQRCDYTTQEIIKCPGQHTVVADPAVDPTYSTEGKTAGSHCSACGEVIVKQEVIPAKSLLWLWILIAVVVVVAAGVVVYFFVFKKNAKTKHIGRPGAKK